MVLCFSFTILSFCPLSLVGAATSIILVVTKVLSRQAYLRQDKHVFVTTKQNFCWERNDTCGSSHQ